MKGGGKGKSNEFKIYFFNELEVKLKKVLITILMVCLVATMSLLGVSCKTGQVAETAAATTAAAETAAAETAAEETEAPEVEEAAFDWRQFEGTTINLMGVGGPYNPEIQECVESFTALTGINIGKLDFIPEKDYYSKAQLMLSAKSGEYDILMVGFPMLFDMVPPGWLAPLDELMANPAITDPNYNAEDIFPSLWDNLHWTGVNGQKLGIREGAHLWALPVGFMTNTLLYNKAIFDKHGLQVPTNHTELIETGLKIQELEPSLSSALSIRGMKGLSMLYGAAWILIKNYGGTDFDENGDPAFASEENILGLTRLKEIVEKIGNKNNWANFDWENCMVDWGQGTVAMTIDAVPFIAWTNMGMEDPYSSPLAAAPMIYGDDPNLMNSSTWSWNLGINASSDNMEAAWLFLQYVTGQQMTAEGIPMIMPPRQSVWQDPDWLKAMEYNTGLIDAWNGTIDKSVFPFTPNAGFNDYAVFLSGEIQNAVLGTKSPEDALKAVDKYYLDNYK